MKGMTMKSQETNRIAVATALLTRVSSRSCCGALVAVTLAFHTIEAGGQQPPATNSPSLAASSVPYVEGELLVKLRGGEAKPKIAISPHDVMGAKVLRGFPAIGWEHVQLPEGMTVGQGIKAYLALSGVLAFREVWRTARASSMIGID